ncbi:capsid triplex protein 2 [Silurid herpesvirus 1]|nr:capsid triplex protein 2 [Silurid herpesvirus 1]
MACITGQLSPMYVNNVNMRGAYRPYIPVLEKFDPRELEVPKGVFVPMSGTKYFPTVHGMQPPIHMPIGIVQTGGLMSEPMSIDVIPGKLYTVLNTGRDNLRVGDQFTVQFPEPEDVEAQIRAYKKPGTRRLCNNSAFMRMGPLWGGFMAVKKIDPMVTRELLHKLTRDVTTAGCSELLYGMADLYGTMKTLDKSVDGLFTKLAEGGAATKEEIGAALTSDQVEIIKKLLDGAGIMLNNVNFGTIGMYHSSTLANPSPSNPQSQVWCNNDGVTEPGLQFNAFIKQFSGV